MPDEVEIKFAVADLRKLSQDLLRLGFHLATGRTHEMNVLYDLPGRKLMRRGELLRLRKYGNQWKLTHKSKGSAGKHKVRAETETAVEDGGKAEAILKALGLSPSFRYEKYRTEWSDGAGHVVVDETPIGNYGEIEGPPRWIDGVARALGIAPSSYITKSYAELFQEWRKKTKSKADEMTFVAVGRRSLGAP